MTALNQVRREHRHDEDDAAKSRDSKSQRIVRGQSPFAGGSDEELSGCSLRA
jgi:hypothetical protein